MYGLVRLSYLKILDQMYNHVLRMCFGAFRTFSAISFCVQTTKLFVALRRKANFTILPEVQCKYK